jgi:hypothetical protein
MTTKARNIIAGILLSALLAATTTTARAQTGFGGGITSKGQVAALAALIVAVPVGIGFGVYFAVRHNHSLTGCAVSVANGFQLQSQGDRQAYALVGDTAGITSGERVRVSGKREKKSDGAPRQFLVEKLNKTYGSCTVGPAAP